MKIRASKSELYDIFEILLFSIVIILNSLSTFNAFFGLMIGYTGIITLIFHFFSGNIKRYMKVYLLLLFSGLEVSRFALGFEVNTVYVYNFIRLPILNMNHFYLLTIAPILLILKRGNFLNIKSRLKNMKGLKMFFGFVLFTIFIGFITSLFTILFNDNNIVNQNVFWEMLKLDIIQFGILFLISFYIIYLLVTDVKNSQYFEKFLMNFLFGLAISTIVTYLFGLHGYYGFSYDIQKVLLLPLSSFFTIMLLIFPFYSDYKSESIYYLFGVAVLLIMLQFPSPLGGKWWLIVMSIPIITIYSFLKRLTYVKILRLIVISICTVSVFVLIYSLIDTESYLFSNELVSIKLDQAFKTLQIFDENWYNNLPNSPKFRFDEFVNICFEYINKPLYSLFGKGLGGSIVQHTNTLNWNNLSAFTLNEITAGLYFKLHESVNVIFLKSGIFGLFFMGRFIAHSILKIKESPWIAIGLFWLAFFYGSYFSMYFGLVALLVGTYIADNNLVKRGLKFENKSN